MDTALSDFFVQNGSQIITAFSSFASAFIGGFVSTWVYKKQLKADNANRKHNEKISAYIELLSSYQDIRDLAIEYASYDKFPDDGPKYENVLSRYCSIANRIKNATVRVNMYISNNLANKTREFYEYIYRDFICYLQNGTTQLTNDSEKPDSKLNYIMNQIVNIENNMKKESQ